MEKGVIEVRKVDVKDDIVTFRVSHEGPVARFFLSDSFSFKAGHPLDDVPLEILVIPLLGGLVPLSWLTDSVVVADEVDETYLAGLSKVREVMQKSYPGVHVQGAISAKPVRSRGTWDPKRYCLLYSGGIDSVTSYIRNLDKKPELLMVRGTPDLRLGDGVSFSRSVERLSPFVREMGGSLHHVETNALDVLDFKKLQGRVRSPGFHGWWENFAHGLFLLSMCAPFTYHRRIGRLLISSSDTERLALPWGSMPESDKEIRWGGLEVIHDSYDYTKFEKITEVLVPFLSNRGRTGIPISVCTGKQSARVASGRLNCGRCGKCTRTMLMLLENGIDTDECEFDVAGFSPPRIRIGLENGYVKIPEASDAWGFVLDNAQKIDPRLEQKYRGMNALMSWMAGWDRRPKESRLRSYSRRLAPVGSRRRRHAKTVLRKR